jgi:phage gp16-like protein
MTATSIGASARRLVSGRQQSADRRKKLIIAVHAAARQLGLNEDARRDVYRRVTGKAGESGKDSLTQMTLPEIGKVLDALNIEARSHGQASRTTWARKARALWITAYWCGIVDDRAESAMDAFITRQTGIARREWITGDKAVPVIEALKSMLGRHGFTAGWSSGDNPAFYYARELHRKCTAAALANDTSLEEFADMELGIEPAPRRGIRSSAYSYDDCNRIIEALGALWRTHLARDPKED